MLDHQVMWEGVYMDEPGSLLENNHDVEIDNSFEFAIMEQPVTECWLLPDDIDIHSVDTMYRVMTTCQTLHPDSEDTNSDESEDEFAIGGIIHEDQEAGNSDENGRAESCVMGGMMQELNLEDERFEDAEE
ncbi:methylosome subunit pICln isoform X2 [Scaptodrosophila lebanonensis]|nr:methylosome subunit pICln isoform X2 [Scaptodrosophila lebanonensis]XP_030388451.1 methylosome subunit pICln isoform X2 [Scaptodrosophila lebanonensis]